MSLIVCYKACPRCCDSSLSFFGAAAVRFVICLFLLQVVQLFGLYTRVFSLFIFEIQDGASEEVEYSGDVRIESIDVVHTCGRTVENYYGAARRRSSL